MPDTPLFTQLFHAHQGRVYQWALRYTGGRRALAEDIVQEVFMRLHESLERLHGHADLGGWLFRVTANTAVSRLRRERFSLKRLRVVWGGGEEADEPRVELAHDARRAVEALERFPPKERVVLSMKLFEGLNNREVAQALELSEGYVTKLTQRAFARLRSEGWEVPDDEG